MKWLCQNFDMMQAISTLCACTVQHLLKSAQNDWHDVGSRFNLGGLQVAMHSQLPCFLVLFLTLCCNFKCHNSNMSFFSDIMVSLQNHPVLLEEQSRESMMIGWKIHECLFGAAPKSKKAQDGQSVCALCCYGSSTTSCCHIHTGDSYPCTFYLLSFFLNVNQFGKFGLQRMYCTVCTQCSIIKGPRSF